MNRFDCKDPTYLSEDQEIVITGLTLSREVVDGLPMNVVGQSKEIELFLKEKGLWDVKCVDSPMPERNTMLGGVEVGENVQSWCRSVIGGLQHFVKCVRCDAAHAVSCLFCCRAGRRWRYQPSWDNGDSPDQGAVKCRSMSASLTAATLPCDQDGEPSLSISRARTPSRKSGCMEQRDDITNSIRNTSARLR